MNILIVQVLRIGDAVQLIPVISAVARLFPGARITLLTSRLGADIFECVPGVEDIAVLRKEEIFRLVAEDRPKGLCAALSMLKEDLAGICKKEWDWVINVNYTFYSALISYLLNARHFSGFTANCHRQFVAREPAFSLQLASFLNRRYTVFNWVDINLQALGLKKMVEFPLIRPQREEREKARSMMQIPGHDGPVIGLNPGASGDYKRWPVESSARLAKGLATRGCRLVIFGGPSERSMGEAIAKSAGRGVVDLTGRTDIKELAACLQSCDLLVTNDTGPMHIAAAVGTKTLSIFFGTNHVESGPYGSGHIVLAPPLDCYPCPRKGGCKERECLRSIGPREVEKVVLSVIGGRNPAEGINPLHLRMFESFFDENGLLSWKRLSGPPEDLLEAERSIIKGAWLELYSGGNKARAVKRDLVPGIKRLKEELFAMKKDLAAAAETALQIQGLFACGAAGHTGIEEAGRRLMAIEERLKRIKGASVTCLLKDFLEERRMNIERTDPMRLAGKTAMLYRESENLAAAMIMEAKKYLGKGRESGC